MNRLTVVALSLAVGCKLPPAGSVPAPTTAADVGPTARQPNERPWVPLAAKFSSYAITDEESLAADVGLSADAEPVPDSTIDRLLRERVALPPHMTVAALHLPGAHVRQRWFMSSETNDMTQRLADSTIAVLSRSTRVARVAILPSVLIGEQRTVRALRESAARIQAEALFLFRPNCRLYQRYPFMGSSQYRAVCTVEAVVLHTRTGVIPFSTVISRESTTQRRKEDFDESGTWARVQLDAVLLGLVEASQRVGTFLETVPQQDQP